MPDEPASADASSRSSSSSSSQAAPDTVGAVAELYLGNILYAIERCALALDADEKPLDGAFYRAIGRKLAEAHGRSKE